MNAQRILVTAGSTDVPIDRVRVISNIFRGRTGTAIAEHFAARGHDVLLLTSSPELAMPRDGLEVVPFKTYDDLAVRLEETVTGRPFDAVIHSAAVSDFAVTNVCVMGADGRLTPIDRSAKISSNHPKLYLETAPTRKLIDLMRTPWNFRGFLVKFKLQVGISDEELIGIAQKSRVASDADLCVANCLEWANKRAYVVRANGTERVARGEIAAAIEREFHAHLARRDR